MNHEHLFDHHYIPQLCLTPWTISVYKLYFLPCPNMLFWAACVQKKFVATVVKTIERSKEDEHEVTRGWYTTSAMKTELKWDAFLAINTYMPYKHICHPCMHIIQFLDLQCQLVSKQCPLNFFSNTNPGIQNLEFFWPGCPLRCLLAETQDIHQRCGRVLCQTWPCPESWWKRVESI